MEQARLFLALDVDQPVRKRLIQAMQFLREAVPRARWCREDALHLTLWFFGTLPLASVSIIGAAVAPVAAETTAFAYTLRGIGGFPSLERPRVLWAGVGDGAQEVKQLAAVVQSALQAQGFCSNEREFVPHVTLARINERRQVGVPTLQRVLPDFATRDFGNTAADRLVLYASELRSDGPVYSVVDSWELEGA
ncbi:MAG: RNA 2',3'-cyclic phosphodiesterase [bacterium]|nr:RNA 2',3'-cyclic phosphodiesterase [bacterium]